MQKIIYLFLLISILGCNEIPNYEKFCILNTLNSREICVPFSNDITADVFEVLSKIELYNIVPDSSKYIGEPQLVITDGKKISDDFLSSDSVEFILDDSYYNQYEYNKIGLIQRFSFIDNVKFEVCIEVNYSYSENKLTEILAINPNGLNHDKNFNIISKDTLYKVKLTYNTENLLETIKTQEYEQFYSSSNGKTLYNTLYKQ